MIHRSAAATSLAFVALMLLLVEPVAASPAGEAHRTVPWPLAAARRADHKPELNVTIWYPAVSGSTESPVTIGPPGQAFFDVEKTALNAPPIPGLHPTILLSHGFGGSAKMMGWLAAPLARNGYVVIGVDHPGNSNGDMTIAGSVDWWDRPHDMIAALATMERDAQFSRLIDPTRIGAAGFSMGGMTALALGGGKIDIAQYDAYCRQFGSDLTCQPPPEMKLPHVSVEEGIKLAGLSSEAAHAGDGTALPGIRAVLAIAPNAQALSQASLQAIAVPVVLVAGSADPVLPIERHAGWASHLIKNARLVTVPGATHYSFLATCTSQGRITVGQCRYAPAQDSAHLAAIYAARRLFDTTLHQPASTPAASHPPAHPY